MKILELQINELIDEYNSCIDSEDDGMYWEIKDIQSWHFSEEDLGQASPLMTRIHKVIEEADLMECLLSTASYIREYKLFLKKSTKQE